VHDLELLHQRRAVVRDGHIAGLVVDQLVHAARPERGAHNVHDRLARVNIADQLRLPLRRVGALLEKDDLRLHHAAWSGRALR